MPSAVADRLGELGADLWSMAQALAVGRLAGERATLDAARAQLGAAKTEAADLVNALTAELEADNATLAHAQALHAAAVSEVQSLRQQLTTMRMQAAIADARAGEIEKQVANLNAELGRVHQQNNELPAALAAAARPPGPDKQAKG